MQTSYKIKAQYNLCVKKIFGPRIVDKSHAYIYTTNLFLFASYTETGYCKALPQKVFMGERHRASVSMTYHSVLISCFSWSPTIFNMYIYLIAYTKSAIDL